MSNTSIFERLFERAAIDRLRIEDILREAEMSANIATLRSEIAGIAERWLGLLNLKDDYSFSFDRAQFIGGVSFFISNGMGKIVSSLRTIDGAYNLLKGAFPNAGTTPELISRGENDISGAYVTAAGQLSAFIASLELKFPFMSEYLTDGRDFGRAMRALDIEWFNVYRGINPDHIVNGHDDTKRVIDVMNSDNVHMSLSSYVKIDGAAVSVALPSGNGHSIATRATHSVALAHQVLQWDADFVGFIHVKVVSSIQDQPTIAIAGVGTIVGLDTASSVLVNGNYVRTGYIIALGFPGVLSVNVPVTTECNAYFNVLGVTDFETPTAPLYSVSGAKIDPKMESVRMVDLVSSNVKNVSQFWNDPKVQSAFSLLIGRDTHAQRVGADTVLAQLDHWYKANKLTTDTLVLGMLGLMTPYQTTFWVIPNATISRTTKQNLYRQFVRIVSRLVNTASLDPAMASYFALDQNL
jgi:hypothetical protein